MKKLLILTTLALFLGVCLTSFGESAPIPDLKGVWQGTATIAWARADLSTPQTQKFMDYTITITITDQNQDLVLGKMEARGTVGPADTPNVPGPSSSADFAGVVSGDNELHFYVGDVQGAVGSGKLVKSSLKPQFGQKQTISGYWLGPLSGVGPLNGTAARFSVSKTSGKPKLPPVPGPGPAKAPTSK